MSLVSAGCQHLIFLIVSDFHLFTFFKMRFNLCLIMVCGMLNDQILNSIAAIKTDKRHQ